jgi:hypothetical protein
MVSYNRGNEKYYKIVKNAGSVFSKKGIVISRGELICLLDCLIDCLIVVGLTFSQILKNAAQLLGVFISMGHFCLVAS